MKKLLSLIVMVFAFFPIYSTTFSDGTFEYELNSEEQTAILTKLIEQEIIDVYIPRSVFYNDIEYSVIEISSEAFNNSKIESLEISKTITKIPYYSLCFCPKLTNIHVDSENPNYCSVDGVLYTKSMSCMEQCPPARQGKFIIPNGVQTLDNGAFAECKYVTEIEIPNTVAYIASSVFQNCCSLTNITFPSSVKSIGIYIFAGCYNLKSIDVDENNKAFCSYNGVMYNKNMDVIVKCPSAYEETLFIPNTLINTDNGFFDALYDCYKLRNIEVGIDHPTFSTYKDILCSKDLENIIYCPKGYIGALEIPENFKSIEKNAFGSCINITSITIPQSITSIGDFAFNNCKNLTEVVMPNTVSTIGTGVFSGCSSLTHFTIPNSVTTIGIDAFRTSGLTNIVIPNSVTTIGGSAFCECTNLECVIIGNSVSKVDDCAFVGCPKLLYVLCYANQAPTLGNMWIKEYGGALYVPKGLKERYASSFFGRSFENIIDNLNNIGFEKIFNEETGNVVCLGPNSTCIIEPTLHAFGPASGIQCDLSFPQGVSLTDVNTEKESMNLKTAYNKLENGDYRVLIYTTDGSTLEDIKLGMSFSSDATIKRGKITCHNVIHSIFDQEINLEEESAYVTGYDIKISIPENIIEEDTIKLLNPIESAPEDVTFKWSTSDSNIATINNSTLTAHKTGSVEILLNIIDPLFTKNFSHNLEVLAALWGDADGSEAIDVADIVTMVNHILGRNPENFNSRLADIDRNGRINIADLTALIRIMLTQPQTETVEVHSRALADDINREISFGEAEDLGGDYLRVPVEIDVTDNCSAMQGEITIPEGMSLEKISLAGELTGHTLDYAMTGSNTARFVLYSMSLASLPADRKSAVASVTLHGHTTTADKTLYLHDALVCGSDCATRSLGGAMIDLEGMSGLDTVTASGFGVKTIKSGLQLTAPAETRARITDLSGRTVAELTAPASVSLPAGMYIVSFNDGPVMKVIVK